MCAAVVVVIGLVIYLATQHRLPPDPPIRRTRAVVTLEPGDGAQIAVLVMIVATSSLFWVAQSQIWNAYPVWVRDRVDRHMFGLVAPVTWFQSVDSLGTILFGPVVIWLWARQQKAGTEPADVTKIVWGTLGFAASELLLAAGELLSGGRPVGVLWALSFHMLSAIGWLYAVPVIVALVARAAPWSIKATAISAYYFAIFIGSTVSGSLGKYYGVLPTWQVWALHAGFAVACSLIFTALAVPMNRLLSRMSVPSSP